MSDPFDAIRQAINISPDNVPLRIHLADMLRQHGRNEEAEAELREALTLAPEDDSLKLALADLYYQQSKNSHALVIVEEMLKRRNSPPAARLLHARLLVRTGDIAFAISEYREATDEDETLRDLEFEERLGIDSEDPEEEEIVDGRIRQGWGAEEEPSSIITPLDKPETSFADVGGMESLKEEIRLKIIYPLEHADMYAAYGKSIGGGILMYGPPGCGKTHLARATAGEINSSFLSVGINEILDMWIGGSEKRLHEIFEQARRNTPCVLFFDEVDALGASRSDMRQSAGRHLINQFLSELDGVEYNNDGVLILGATNAPWHLDSAFRRPGRFDRILFVPPPDVEARAGILRIICQGKPTQNVDHEHIAKRAKDFSGADLKAVIDKAVETKLQKAMKTGVPEPLTTKDLTAAVKQVRPSTKEWFSTARNYALYSNEGGMYDDIRKFLGL
jgi:SpoVK/Ycf46/Vps4 family AAA+-type ATPase